MIVILVLGCANNVTVNGNPGALAHDSASDGGSADDDSPGHDLPGGGATADGGGGTALLCTPGASVTCYTGPDGTEGMGICAAGWRTCLPDGKALSECAGQVLPTESEICGNGLDDDCNGVVDGVYEGCPEPPSCVPTLGWQITTVDANDDVQFDNGIAVDHALNVWISYYDISNGDVKIAYKPNGGDWERSTLDATNDSGWGTDIAVDIAGGIWVSYSHNGDAVGNVKVAHKVPGQDWVTEFADEELNSGTFGSKIPMDADGAGGIWVSRPSAFGNDLEVHHRPAGGEWQSSWVKDPGDDGWFSSIAGDGEGGAWVSFTDHNEGFFLQVAHGTGDGTWDVSTVDYDASVAAATSLAVDSTGGVWVSYEDVKGEKLAVAHKPNGADWEVEWVDDLPGEFAGDTALAVDRWGTVWVSYYDDSTKALKAARKPLGQMWQVMLIDDEGEAGDYNSIAVDGIGGAWVSYRENTGFQLKAAYFCP